MSRSQGDLPASRALPLASLCRGGEAMCSLPWGAFERRALGWEGVDRSMIA